MADEDEIVLSFGDSLLRQSDMNLLKEPNWINDNLMAFCFEYFEREEFNHSADKLALLSPSLTQIMRFASVEDLTVLLEPLGLPTKQFVFVPVNDNVDTEHVGGTHWSLLVYIRSKQEFQHYDAFNGNNKSVARSLVDKLQPFVQAPRGKLKFVEMDCPQQQNGYDCGMYVISMAEHLIKEFVECFSITVHETVTQESVQKKRGQLRELVEELRQHCTENGADSI